MKFKVTMKDSDVLYDAINDALDEELIDISEDEAEVLRDIRMEKIQDITGEWFEYGEYLTVEINTEEHSIRVVAVGEKDE